MSISTYSELKTEVANLLHRDDLTSQIPTFITLAEARLNRELETSYKEDREDLSTVAGQESYSLPDDFSGVKSVYLESTPRVALEHLPINILKNIRQYKTQGWPTYFSINNNRIELAPIPDSVYTVRMVYDIKLNLSDSSPTNNVLTNYPDIYLYASIAEAAEYIRDEQLLAVAEGRLDKSLSKMKKHESNLKYGSTPLVMRTQYV